MRNELELRKENNRLRSLVKTRDIQLDKERKLKTEALVQAVEMRYEIKQLKELIVDLTLEHERI